MPLPALEDQLTMTVVDRLAALLAADETLQGAYDAGGIRPYPGVKAGDETVIPYLFTAKALPKVASTLAHRHDPTLALALRVATPKGTDVASYWRYLNNVTDLFVDALYNVRADPTAGGGRLWHNLTFVGAEGGGTSYDREPEQFMESLTLFTVHTHHKNRS